MADLITDALIAEWVALQGPAQGGPASNADVDMGELSKKRKGWLKSVAEANGTSGKKLEKELKKALKKRKPKAVKAKKENKPKNKNNKKKKGDAVEVASDEQYFANMLPEPDTNRGRGAYFVNSEELLAKHLGETGGNWMTRFPPEPNGYLHIGHAKAMLFSFTQAKVHGGNCYLRFDDTNPNAEKQEYVDSIVENVKWLGHKPFKITHSSDYFQELHDLAVQLIKRGKAYVCHQTPEEVKASREALKKYHGHKAKLGADASIEDLAMPSACASPWRDAPISENLEKFSKMREGEFKEGDVTLRMKGDLFSTNPNMWDLMAYRISHAPHPQTGTKWCIYPTYDFTHCLVDSLENVTHSLCTLEFYTRQVENSAYHWLLEALSLYHPYTWEFSRCCISRTTLSKRRLNKLVTSGVVNGWDDPRILTLDGLRRRGYTSSSINAFCKGLGVARGAASVCVPMHRLQSCIRAELDACAPRVLAVLDPLKVTVANFPEGQDAIEVTCPNHPQKPEMGSRVVPFTRVVYMSKARFKDTPEKGFRGMTPGGTVRFLNAFLATCTDVERDAAGNVVGVTVEATFTKGVKPPKGTGILPWVPSTAIAIDEVREYGDLFDRKMCTVTSADGSETEVNVEAAAKERGKDFMDLLAKDSLKVHKGALVEPSVAGERARTPGSAWQFITLGYFCVDKDTAGDRLVLNEIVSLKETRK